MNNLQQFLCLFYVIESRFQFLNTSLIDSITLILQIKIILLLELINLHHCKANVKATQLFLIRPTVELI